MGSSARRKIFPRIAATAASVITAASIANSGTALASYGPPPPPNGPPPGAFNCIVTSRPVGPSGLTLGPLSIEGIVVRLRIRRRTFPVTVQLTVTEPDLGSSSCPGPDISARGHGYHIIGGVGILAYVNSQLYRRFARPLILTIGESSTEVRKFSPFEVLLASGPSFGRVVGVGRRRPITITLRTSSDFVVLGRERSRLHRVEGLATSTQARSAAIPVAEFVAAALLPPSAPLPGLGVLLQTGADSTLTAVGATSAPLR